MGRRINLIVNKITKGYEIRQDKPNENWIEGADVFIVEDETELSDKIIDNYPYFEFTLDVNGGLIDITPTERPPKPPEPPSDLDAIKEIQSQVVLALVMGGLM